jgi:hypothetical protein
MIKLKSKKQKKSLFYEEKSLVGFTHCVDLTFHTESHFWMNEMFSGRTDILGFGLGRLGLTPDPTASAESGIS